MQRSTNMPTCEVGIERISGVGPKLGHDGQGYRYLAQAELVDGPRDGFHVAAHALEIDPDEVPVPRAAL